MKKMGRQQTRISGMSDASVTDSRTHVDVKAPSPSRAAKSPKPLFVLGLVGASFGSTNIEDCYALDCELCRDEFGITYLCIDRSTRILLVCKSISKCKLHSLTLKMSAMRSPSCTTSPQNSSIVSLHEACEDDRVVHLVMELCEGVSCLIGWWPRGTTLSGQR